MNRREFLSATALAAAAWAVPSSAAALTDDPSIGSFDFVYFTDTHIQPELAATDGCSAAFKKIRQVKADFAVQGGDHVFDALGQSRERASGLYDLYGQTQHLIEMQIHHVIGNHDAFGVYAKTGIALTDKDFGKKMYEDRIGKTYYSFDHKGHHFVVLDSIQVTEDRSWEARIDAAQLTWLRNDLSKVSPRTPVVVIVHVPLVTGAASYASPREGKGNQGHVMNAYEVLPLFASHNVLGVLQGHTHINEVVSFRGVPYITSGAVCGNWWHGTCFGTPEGYTIVSLRDGKMTWRYETYGFKSIDPQGT
jgi:Icc protein